MYALEFSRRWELHDITIHEQHGRASYIISVQSKPICREILTRDHDTTGASVHRIQLAVNIRDVTVRDHIRAEVWITSDCDRFIYFKEQHFFFPIYFVQGNEFSAYISIHSERNCAEQVIFPEVTIAMWLRLLRCHVSRVSRHIALRAHKQSSFSFCYNS